MKIGIATFILPGQEQKAMKLINDPMVTVTINERHPMPKEGIILLYIEYEDHREKEGALDDDA